MNELRVSDVFANIEFKGKATKEQVAEVYDGWECKAKYNIGNGSCGNQSCEQCFNTLMSDLQERDEVMYDYDHQYDDEVTEDYDYED